MMAISSGCGLCPWSCSSQEKLEPMHRYHYIPHDRKVSVEER